MTLDFSYFFYDLKNKELSGQSNYIIANGIVKKGILKDHNQEGLDQIQDLMRQREAIDL